MRLGLTSANKRQPAGIYPKKGWRRERCGAVNRTCGLPPDLESLRVSGRCKRRKIHLGAGEAVVGAPLQAAHLVLVPLQLAHPDGQLLVRLHAAGIQDDELLGPGRLLALGDDGEAGGGKTVGRLSVKDRVANVWHEGGRPIECLSLLKGGVRAVQRQYGRGNRAS